MRLVAAVLLSIASAQTSLRAQEPETPPPAAAPIDFVREVAPLLLQRCIECHGPKEQKGDLRLDAREYAFAEGAEDYWSIAPGDPDDSELLRRVALPVEDDDFMPQKGEALSKDQVAMLRRWIVEGAVWPAKGDEWLAAELAAQVLPKITFELPPLDDAGRAAIAAAREKLLALGAVVQTVAGDTDALDVNLSLLRERIGDQEMALLRPLAPRLVWLNVARTAIGDASGGVLAALPQLRRLNVANTAIGDAALARLGGLGELEYLNAYGTGLGDDGLRALAGMPKLRRLYVWQTKVSEAAVASVRGARADLELDLGDYVEARLAAAQREIAERERRSQPINEICPVADKPVDKSKTARHEGRVVAFCCDKCKAAFAKDPAAYVGKLPAAATEPVGEPAPKVEGRQAEAPGK